MKLNWIAASENTKGRYRRPAFPPNQAMSLSNQIIGERRFFSASLWVFRFVLRSWMGSGLLIRNS